MSACCSIRQINKEIEDKAFTKWLSTSEIFFEANGNFYLKHYAESKADHIYNAEEEKEAIEELKSVAEVQAYARIIEQINSNIKSRTVYVKSDSIEKGRFHSAGSIAKTDTDFFALSSGDINNNISVEDIYMQKSIVKKGRIKEIFYRCFLLVKIPIRDYEKMYRKRFEK